MPFEPNTINYLLSGALGAIISGLILLVNNYLNNKSQSEREEKQHIRQLEREEQQGIRQQKSDQQKWYREKIYDSYRTSINLLTEMIQIEFEVKENYMTTTNKYIKLHKLSLKLLSEFDIITSGYVSGHPIKNTKEFKEKMIKFAECLETDSRKARTIITDLMENDPRIKDINNT